MGAPSRSVPCLGKAAHEWTAADPGSWHLLPPPHDGDTLSTRITPLTDPDRTSSSRRLAWLASDTDGVPVGSAFLRLFTKAGQDHLAELELNVHPAERRNRVGSRLLDAAVAAARADGRRCVITQAKDGSAADRFLPAQGFRNVLTLTFARLSL